MISKLLNIVNDLQVEIPCVLTGSLALYLQDFKLNHDPEDIDLIVLKRHLEEINKKYDIIQSNVYPMLYNCIIDDIKIDIIVKDELYYNNYISIKCITNYYIVSCFQDILFNKLYCCLNSKEHKDDHIEELYYILKNNQDKLAT